MKQTIAQQIKWDFKTNGDLEIRDKNNELIYWENSKRVWRKWEYDSKGNCIYFDNSGLYWERKEYDEEGNLIYWENSNGKFINNKPKSFEGKIIEFDGEKFKLVKV